MNYWHFSREDKRLNYGDGRLIEVGVTHTVEPPVKLCEHGLHASKYAADALNYAPGPVLWLVELSGEVIHDDDKSVATERKYLAEIDATELLREHARWCALQVIELWDAPDVVRRYLESGEESLRAAARAAGAAAGAAGAAWAAGAAAWAAGAAAGAAWAAGSAAGAAGAARAAAWAARDASDASRAARAAARDAQRDNLEKLVNAAFWDGDMKQTNTADLTVSEVAEILNCSDRTVRRLIKDGNLSAYKLDPDNWHSGVRIRPESLEALRGGDNDRQ